MRPADGSTAYDKLIVQPNPVGDLRHVRGGYNTPQGPARSSWTKSGHRFELRSTIPANTTAEVRVPTDGYEELRKPARATFLRTEGKYAIYSVPSGQFTFTATKR
ncbi:alpha-L-rhamnosidase C-terminal domain-containing protein [Spirillospora sp. CA-255316]